MIRFVREYVSKYIPETEIRMDILGNLYITKGETGIGYPTLVCHMDQVQTLHSEDFEVRQEGDMLYGWSEQNQQREGLGADDKNGIYIAIRCLEECPRLKVFMAVGEKNISHYYILNNEQMGEVQMKRNEMDKWEKIEGCDNVLLRDLEPFKEKWEVFENIKEITETLERE